MSITKTQYTIQGWRAGQGDPSADLILNLGNNDAGTADPAVIAELIRDHVASISGIISVEVRRSTTDVIEVLLPPL
jgi:hypothetical protein